MRAVALGYDIGRALDWQVPPEDPAAFIAAVGLRLAAGDAVRAEEALERAGVALIALRTTPAGIILRVPNERCEDAVRALHAALIDRPA